MPVVHGRVALFMATLTGGGAERVMLNLAGEFARRGFRVDLVLIKAWGPFRNQIPPGIRLVDLGTGRAYRSVPALSRYLKSEKPEAMVSALHHPNVVAILASLLSRMPMRLVVAVHGKIGGDQASRNLMSALLLPPLVRLTYRWADVVVAVSEGTAEEVARFLRMPAEKIRVIVNPVLNDGILHAGTERLDDPWFAPGQPPVIVSAGRFVPLKNFSLLIEAFSLLRVRLPARLIILGDGPLRAEYLSKAKQFGIERDVALPGFMQNPYHYYAHAALFAHSSDSEALPTALIEALACGTPVISTDCPNGPREILENGRYGHLVAPGDAQAMASAMEEVLRGDRRVPPKEILARYAMKSVADEYIGVLFPEGMP